MDSEVWKDVTGYEGCYQVSNQGKIRSLDRVVIDTIGRKRHIKGKLLHPKANVKSGYLMINLKGKDYYIHRLVAQAFLPNPMGLPQVNHKDETRDNNCVDNLEWCDIQYNHDYGTRTMRESNTKSKSVQQFSLEGKLLATYKSASESCRITGVNRRTIQMVASNYTYIDNSGKKVRYLTAGGYKWRYVERS